MDKIICLVGESGSGKSTMAELLEKEGFNYIQSFTTRKKRYLGEKGHIFTDNIVFQKHKNLDKVLDNFKIIASTCFDGNYYWSVNTQYRNKGKSVYVIDPVGVKELKENIKDAEIIVIYLNCDSKIRTKRMYDRIGKLNNLEQRQKLKESIFQRSLHDEEAFKVIECDYVIKSYGRYEEKILEDIKEIINA